MQVILLRSSAPAPLKGRSASGGAFDAIHSARSSCASWSMKSLLATVQHPGIDGSEIQHIIKDSNGPSTLSCEDLTPSKQEESSPEGSTVTLSYRYSKTIAANDYFYWYRQYPGKPPEFLILHWGTKPASNSRLSVKSDEDKTQIYLSISSVAVTDSAVYSCAVKPTVTGNTNTLYKNLCCKDNTILHSIHQRESLSVRL
ncbi:hypothetical protein JOQ06_023023 [Pogonophryne albipinna]|uniref:Ig-like domain-containing protein n=1 Tax=Pogonophryne albipinna TaxID=1090488 RepID=A0AAD6A765_9TELE|nr:hypothetical protein JOQ06_023023 [Pogonophryne albipinna]